MSGGKADDLQRQVDVEGKAHVRLVTGRPPAKSDDPDLLTKAAAGDAAAVRLLYRTHVDRVHRHVARVLGAQDPDVEDVVQRVFLAALDGAASYRGDGKLGSWILGIATRRALDESRARWRRGRWKRMTERVGLGRPASSPDARAVAGGEAERLLQTLSPEQRTAFVLKEVEGHTLQEMSDMTGIGVSTLHARVKAARKRLDAAIAESGNGRSGGPDA